MNKYLTWDCPKCGKAQVCYVRIDKVTGYLFPDGTEDQEEQQTDEYEFLCARCNTEVHRPDGSTFDDPINIAEFFTEDEDGK